MDKRRDFIKKIGLTLGTVGVGSMLNPIMSDAFSAPNERKKVLRIAHITDVHLPAEEKPKLAFKKVLQEINNMKDRPDLIINTGDTVMDMNGKDAETNTKLWSAWHEVNQVNKIKMYSCLGNHDVWYGKNDALDQEYKRDKRYGKAWAINELKLPNRYYETPVLNGWKFIALDSITYDHGYKIDDEQLQWLTKILETTPASTNICIFSHVPIITVTAYMYAAQRSPIANVKFPGGDQHIDVKPLKDLFFKHKNVKVCLSGHVHYIDDVEYLGVKYLCGGAVSGNWWGGNWSLDEFPPVYSIIDLYEDGTAETAVKHYLKTIKL